MNKFWPISKRLLNEILADRISDNFVCILIWERLGYQSTGVSEASWEAGPNTSLYWSEKFPEAPQLIVQRKASVYLTRSIPKEYKQSLKECLNFAGFRIGELYPRRTRRATAVNWILAWMLIKGEVLPVDGPLPELLDPPLNPLNGHPGDPPVE